MIDYRLKTFLVLCEQMNYRRTAEVLNITQPAVSQHIQYLENEYNCKLFLYDKKTLRKTKEADLLQNYAENIFYQEKKIKEEMHGNQSIHLNIGATKTIGEFVIPNQILKFLNEADNTLNIEVDNTENLLSLLTAGQLDFALIEGYFDRNKFKAKLFREESFVGICHKKHPFANQEVSLADVLHEHLVIREKGSGTRKIFEQFLFEKNHVLEEFQKVTTISNFGLISKTVEKIDAITFAYHSLLNGNRKLTTFNIKNWRLKHEYNYVYLNNPAAEKSVELFDSYR